MITSPSSPSPEIRTGTDAAAFLSRLPMADPVKTHPALTSFYRALCHRPLSPVEQAAVLSQAEKALEFVQDETSKRYLSRPLPYAGADLLLFHNSVGLWQDAADAWLAALPAEGNDSSAAAILERALFCRGMALVAHYMARFQIPQGLWHGFHAIYAECEKRQVATEVLRDSRGRSASCSRRYAAVLLMDLAKPYSLRSRDLAVVWRWSRLLAKLVDITLLEPGTEAPLVIDLAGDTPLAKVQANAEGPSLRRLESSDLASHMRKLRRRLAEDIPPAELQLGEDVAPGDAVRLLSHLKHPWTQASVARPFDLGHQTGTARVVLGYDAIHFHLTGRETYPPKESTYTLRYSREDAERLAILGVGRKEAPATKDDAASRHSAEEWSVLEQSPGAWRLYRPGPGGRVAVGQLVAIAVGEGNAVLTRIAGLMQTASGGVALKATRLPGIAISVAIRALGANPPPQPIVGGFLIGTPGKDPKDTPELVMPRGWYQKKRPVELDLTPPRQCRLDKILFSGHDFDLVECVAPPER